MTYLQAINKVLRGLRENTVADLSAIYTLHIGQLVNEAKNDIEDMGPWYALRTIKTDTLSISISSLDLTASTNERSYLVFTKNMPQAWVTKLNEERILKVIEYGELLDIQTMNPDADEDVPAYVAFTRSNNGLTAHFYPTPDEAYPVKFLFVVPQDDLTGVSDVLSVPAEPVWRAALVAAMDERGEEFSAPLVRMERRATQAKNDAIMRDFGADVWTFERI